MNQLTNQLVWGDIQDAREKSLNGFDRVVTVCQDSVEDNVSNDVKYHHYKLTDGIPRGHNQGICSYALFASATDRVQMALDDGETVFVHCHAGQSRSTMVCTAALAVHEDTTFEAVYHRVLDVAGPTHPTELVRMWAKKYIIDWKVTQLEP